MSSNDLLDWEKEGKAVIDDVKSHVKTIEISKLFTGESWNYLKNIQNNLSEYSSDIGIYINLKTLEDKEFCIYLNREGFKVVGYSFDCCDNEDDQDNETIYETIYACIQNFSPGYTKSFGDELASKLKELPSWSKSTTQQNATARTRAQRRNMLSKSDLRLP